MKITGSYTIDAPRDQVWAALNDIEVLARIVPGCERLTQVGDNEFEGTVKIGIQSIKGTYSGKIRLEDIQPPSHYKLVASGRSANGVVDGAGMVDLAEQDGKTVLSYSGDAQIGGTLASVGQRLIEGASRQLINQSLKALVEQIAARSGPPPATSRPATNGVAPHAAAAAPSTALAAEVEQARPPAPAAEPVAAAPAPPPPLATALAAEVEQARQPASQAAGPAERRTVLVPEHEQLQPAAVIRGVVDDIVRERPWAPWVIVAFLLGYLLGRARRF